MIYFDNAATTRMDDRVLEAMMPYLKENYGNPGARYSFGKRAAGAVSQARERVAEFFGCDPTQVIFTSGGTEGNNMVIQGMKQHLRLYGVPHVITSEIEHDSVLEAVCSLASDLKELNPDAALTFVKPDSAGKITAESVEKELTKDTGLVSIMCVNNETGLANYIKDIAKMCSDRGIVFHTDCVQAAGQVPLKGVIGDGKVDFATISGHKIYGPKGIGAVYARDRNLLSPIILGGKEQEFGFRGGTENVAAIVGLGAACELASKQMERGLVDTITAVKQRLFAQIRYDMELAGLDPGSVHANFNSNLASGKILSLRFDGVDMETLILMLSTADICVSAGSACNSYESKPSHVLTACGLTEDQARSTMRISLSRYTTWEECEMASQAIVSCVYMLRSNKY